jgi:hypothetical protein
MTRPAAALVALALGLTALAAPAAADPPGPRVLARGLTGPLSLAVAANGTVFVSENSDGRLLRVRPGTKPRTVATTAEGEIGAVSVRKGVVHYTTTGSPTALMRIGPGSRSTQVADLGAPEWADNPDGDVIYGFRDLDPACAADFTDDSPPATYTGIEEAHPYATVSARGVTYVADAGANAVLAVRGSRVRTVAVLPAVPVPAAEGWVENNGYPACTVGVPYFQEAVPTGIALAPDGSLVVSTLTGGPEDGSSGAVSRVERVDPRTGRVRVVATGLYGAVGVAVAHNGDIFVSELFADRVSRIRRGSHTVTAFRTVAAPGGIAWTSQGLYVTTDVLGDAGRVVRLHR